jgi:hypothetical protein
VPPITLLVEKVPVAGLYGSVEFVDTGGALWPPATRTCPFGSSLAVEYDRDVLFKRPVGVKPRVAGSNKSADVRSPQQPPSMSTLPLESRTTKCALRVACIGLIEEKVPALGSKSSAELKTVWLAPAKSPRACPPATNTRPSGNKVAVWSLRSANMAPAFVNVPTVGSKISAPELESPAPPGLPPPGMANPPTISTRPSLSRVAVL